MTQVSPHIATIMQMAHSPLHNYVIPGLSSYLIGEHSSDPQRGCVRLFVSEREHAEPITPHSHRFDFTCQVLKGYVHNVIWTPDENGDLFQESTLVYEGAPGKYTKQIGNVQRWNSKTTMHREGDTYQMTAKQVHSIYFSRGAHVLFFEGPTVTPCNLVLEPVTNGQHIESFKTEPWMFKRG